MGQLQHRPEMGLVHPNRSTCSLFLLSTCSAPKLHASEWPNEKSTKSKNIIDGVSDSNANCQNIIRMLILTLIMLHTRPSLSWPSRRSTTWPVTLPCALALPETVPSRVFSKISRAGFLCYETQHFTSP